LLAHGRWFSPGTPASSTTKAEILLKVTLNTKKSSQSSKHYKCNLQQHYLFYIMAVSFIGAGNRITPQQKQSTCNNMAMVFNAIFNNISNIL